MLGSTEQLISGVGLILTLGLLFASVAGHARPSSFQPPDPPEPLPPPAVAGPATVRAATVVASRLVVMDDTMTTKR